MVLPEDIRDINDRPFPIAEIRLDDNAEPNESVSKTLKSDTSRVHPYTEAALPSRVNARIDQALPIETLSSTDKLSAILKLPAKDIECPFG
jgi:hypothetical protein